MDVYYEGEDTVLCGKVVDQAALHGILNRIRDMNLPLLLVEKIEALNRPHEEIK
jgi:hypothetical protein